MPVKEMHDDAEFFRACGIKVAPRVIYAPDPYRRRCLIAAFWFGLASLGILIAMVLWR